MVSAEDGEANNNKADATANTRAIFLEGKVEGANIYISADETPGPRHPQRRG